MCRQNTGVYLYSHILAKFIHKYETTVLLVTARKLIYFVMNKMASVSLAHARITYKLLVHNIAGKIYWAIRSLYEHNISCVKLHGLLSKWFNVDRGVRQGDNLSPTLFGVFINDLAIDIKIWDLAFQLAIERYPYYFMPMILHYWPKMKVIYKNYLINSMNGAKSGNYN